MQNAHHNLIEHYEDVIPDNACDLLIRAFEGSDKLVHRNLGPQDFYEYNLNQDNPQAAQALCQFVMLARQKYQLSHPLESRFWPAKVALEEMRVKRYTGGTEQQFSDHVDVGDCSSAKRYLAFLFYLNDDFEGGQTLFYPGTVIEPKKGSVVVFPPTWAYPHKGVPVLKGTKYIMSSYLNYL